MEEPHPQPHGWELLFLASMGRNVDYGKRQILPLSHICCGLWRKTPTPMLVCNIGPLYIIYVGKVEKSNVLVKRNQAVD